MPTITKTQSLYTLTRPVWLDAAGMSKGIDHDRQHRASFSPPGRCCECDRPTRRLPASSRCAC
ncbi:hypothetical protein M5585_23175 [Serratia ureilytica]